MKYLKLLALCLLPLSFAACSDDDNINGGNATVGFSSAEMSASENSSMIEVPITVEGDHNGLVRVNLDITEVNGVSVTKDETVLLTSKEIVLPAGTSTVYAEIRSLVNTSSDDFDRSFTLTISSAEGASVSTSTCKVNIEELVDPYQKLLGTYSLTAVDLTSSEGATVTFDVELTEGAPGKTFTVEGFDGYLLGYGLTDREFWTLEYNEQDANLSLVKGEYYATGVNFGSFIADCCVAPMDFNSDGTNVIPTTSWSATWNEDYSVITFEENAIMGLALYSGGQYAGWAGAYYNIVLTRK